MPLPEEHIKERLSLSLVAAVAAKAGVACRQASQPEYGTDAQLVAVVQLANGKFRDTGHIINCQVKATTTCQVREDAVIYDMEAEAYNKLAEWEGGSPCILIVLSLAKNPDEWLAISEDEFRLQKCCYWTCINTDPTNNSRSTRITIPRTQLFTPEAVCKLIERLKNEGHL